MLGDLHDDGAAGHGHRGHDNVVGVYHRGDVNRSIALRSLGEAGSREGEHEKSCCCCHLDRTFFLLLLGPSFNGF